MKKIIMCSLLLWLGWLPMLAAAQSGPDLVIVPPFNLPATVLPGGSYAMSAVIKNQGAGGSQFNCIGYYLSADAVWDATDAYLGASCQSLLFTGQSGTCSITATIPALTPAGSRYLLLVADPLNAEQEADETNNVVSFAVTVAGSGSPLLPDLELWRPSLSFAAVPPGGSTGAFTFIFNRGPGAASAYEIGYYLSADTVFSASTDVFLGMVTGGLTTPGGTIHSAPMLTVPATTAPGNYYLVLMADPRNVVAETNENNNSRALPLRVTGLATAVAQPVAGNVAVYPNPAPRGSTIHIELADNRPPRVEVTCYDAMARLVARQWVGGNGRALDFDASRLPAGIYQLCFSGNGLHVARRVQIE